MATRLGQRSIATLSGSIRSAPLSVTRSFSHSKLSLSLSKSVATRLSSPLISLRSFHNANTYFQELAQAEPKGISDPPATQQQGLITRFEDLGHQKLVHDSLVRTLVEDMKLETMTDVQSQTINHCLNGQDVLAQAKTGTGKTLGFLIPAAQRILAASPELRSHSRRRAEIDIRTLVISPTRELAEQIATEAKRLLRNTGIVVQTAVGGTQKRLHLKNMQYEGCHILVATPGRLHDLLTDRYSGVSVDNLEMLVLDEADRLLDDGFAPDLYKIHDILPNKAKKPRQTLMFSATMPKEVMHVVNEFMLPKYEFVRTVQNDEIPTHDRVPQKVVRLNSMQNTFPALMELVKQQREAVKANGKSFKAMIFFNANAEASLYYQLFNNLDASGNTRFATHPFSGITTLEMHSKLSQGQRTRASDLFRRSQEAIMFTSDVTARGMDFPNVTHVIQIGNPRNRESYIHRIGRTGRAGKEGEGWLLVNPIDEGEARHTLRGLPLKRDRSLQTGEVDMTQDSEMPAEIATILTQSVKAAQRTSFTAKSNVFRAFLGTHQWVRNKRDLVDAMNDMTKYGWGMERPPAVSPVLANKLGIGRLSNLNTDFDADQDILRKEAIEEEMSSRGRNDGGRRDYGRPRGRDGGRDGGRGGFSRGGSSRSGGQFEGRGSFGGDRRSFGGDRRSSGRDDRSRASQGAADPWD